MPNPRSLREKAEAATLGPWFRDGPFWWTGGDVNPDGCGLVVDADRNAIVVGPERKDSADDIAYIAAWHPGVALAALDVIEAAEAWSNAEIPHPNEDHALLDALVAWDALTGEAE